jgi:hypothetical protein
MSLLIVVGKSFLCVSRKFVTVAGYCRPLIVATNDNHDGAGALAFLGEAGRLCELRKSASRRL